MSSPPGVPAEAAGYSGTPRTRKLGVKAGHTLLLVGAPSTWSVPGLAADVRVRRRAQVPPSGGGDDVVIAFVATAARLERVAPAAVTHLAPGSALWVAWPRRAGGHQSDVTERLIRDVLLPLGVVDVKVAALDNDWSALKFVWRRENRPR